MSGETQSRTGFPSGKEKKNHKWHMVDNSLLRLFHFKKVCTFWHSWVGGGEGGIMQFHQSVFSPIKYLRGMCLNGSVFFLAFSLHLCRDWAFEKKDILGVHWPHLFGDKRAKEVVLLERRVHISLGMRG